MGTRADSAEPEGFEAGQLARLLADDRRRRLVAAVVLGARTSDEARFRSGLTAREFATALARLVDGGLLVVGDDERLSVIESAFRSAARGPARNGTPRPRLSTGREKAARSMPRVR